MADRPSVLFVCVKNGGKSQMAAALMRHRTGESVQVHSAGTRPGDAVNGLSAQVIEESGGSMADQHPKLIDEDLLRRVDRVVVLGSEATVDPIEGMAGSIEVWSTDEPSARGIDGIDRMRLIRDDIADRVDALIAELTGPTTPVVRVYEPALCCNTGVCGPELDDDLVRFTADLDHLQNQGADLQRHNLANDPTAFTADPAVADFLRVAGSAGLPLTTVDGVTVVTGRYPSRAELTRLAGITSSSELPTGVTDLGLTASTPRGGCGPDAETGCC